MWWLVAIDGPLPIGDIVLSLGIIVMVAEAGRINNQMSDALEDVKYSYQPPSPNNDDDDDYYDNDDNFLGKKPIGIRRGDTPRNNQAQNKQFKDATRGLSKDAKRSFHQDNHGEGLGFQGLINEREGLYGFIIWIFIQPGGNHNE